MNLPALYHEFSEKHPIIGHFIWPGFPVGALGAWGLDALGVWWTTAWIGGAVLVLAVMTATEYADQRAHARIEIHHLDENLRRIAKGIQPVFYGEVWYGWDWRDFSGGVLGGMAGALFALVAVTEVFFTVLPR